MGSSSFDSPAAAVPAVQGETLVVVLVLVIQAWG